MMQKRKNNNDELVEETILFAAPFFINSNTSCGVDTYSSTTPDRYIPRPPLSSFI